MNRPHITMKVKEREPMGEGHSIEWGDSSWDDGAVSVRNRYENSSGRFDPHSSSEIPIGDLRHIVIESAKRGYIDDNEALEMIKELAASVRQGSEDNSYAMET